MVSCNLQKTREINDGQNQNIHLHNDKVSYLSQNPRVDLINNPREALADVLKVLFKRNLLAHLCPTVG